MTSLNLLSQAEVQAIHQATLRVLSETGVVLAHPKGRKLLVDAGARVEDDRVLLPPELVEQQIAKCPPQVRIRGRGGETKTLGDSGLHWHNLGGAPDVYEPRTGQRRPAILHSSRCAR
jgi:trimethylamine--corrinoid protein Co-methyltransferase